MICSLHIGIFFRQTGKEIETLTEQLELETQKPT